MATNFYDILEVPRNASDKEIQSAFRRLARRYHPDVTGGDNDAEQRFKQVNAAHDVLGDRSKRAAYDKWGDRWEHAEQLEEMEHGGGFPFAGRRRAGGGAFNEPGGIRFDFSSGGPDLGGFGQQAQADPGGLGDLFGGLFGGRDPAPPAQGRDIEHPVAISLREAFSGSTRTIRAPQASGASGAADGPRFSRLEVKIPAGVQTGSRVKVSGKGAAVRGGPAGDLYLVITVEDDPRFERKGDDLYTDAPIPVSVAALGGEITVPTLTGRLALRIPQGTQSGRVFRLSGQGMPRLKSGKGGKAAKRGKRGDLLARARLELPDPLSPEQLDLFRQLRDLEQAEADDRSDQ